jgi:hypothetical protein
MNLQSKYAEDKKPETKKKKYLPIGYGGPNTGGRGGFPVDGRFGQEAGLFDIFFEFLGIKKKSRKHSEGDDQSL